MSSLLIEELEKYKLENKALNEKLLHLEEQIAWFKRQIFGQRSEKQIPTPANQPLFEGFETNSKENLEDTRTIPTHKRRASKRIGVDKLKFPEDLPKETFTLDIPEKDKICSETGKPLIKIGEEVTQKLSHKPGSFFIKEIIRPKYAFPKELDKGILTRELPDSIIPKCIADESFLAEVLTRKFADHLPLHRITKGLERDLIEINRKLLSTWVIRIGKTLKPLHDLLLKEVLENKNIFVDETPIQLLAPGKGKTHQGYMWVAVGGTQKSHSCFYQFKLNRKHHNVSDLIGDYRGALHSDKYGAYESLAAKKQFTWCPCWSHIRRKFVEAESGDPKLREWILEKIRDLFMLEREAWECGEEERLSIRQEKEVPIIDELIKAARDRLINGKLLPKSKFREALGYFCGLIPYLKNYTKDPFSRLDNNVAERAIRPLAIGRKNWLFVGSPDGGEAAATIFSLVQTCLSVGVNPREYLEDVLRRFMSHPFNKLDQLLPENWAPAREHFKVYLV